MTTETKIKISFVIPSYRGLKLLQENLPLIIAEAEAGDQIIIAEDGPEEEENIKEHQMGLEKLKEMAVAKKVDWLFLPAKENGRFAVNVNKAVERVKHEFFFLLNNDVQVQKGAREKLLSMMIQDERVFAVTAKEIEAKTGQIGGRNKLWFEKGRFWHSRDEKLNESGETAWACGGSSLYRTSVWRKLGGLDKRYYPAYWEDIDISSAAKKAGYKVLYSHKAEVIHAHETTNESVFGQEKMARISWHNGSRFTWKNGTTKQKLSFLITYPYWLIKQFPALKWWPLVLVFAFLTRFIALGQVPSGLTVDEAAIAYNGYGIWTQRRDEWLNRLPVSFRSFGDYKAPLAIYVNAVSTAIFGLTPWGIRAPFAVASVLSVLFLMLLVERLWRDKTSKSIFYAAIAGFLMSATPWHIHFGRLGFENNFALLLVLMGAYFLLAQIKTERNVKGELMTKKWFSWRLLVSGIALALSLYSYHSTKVFLPFFLIAILVAYGRYWRQNWRLLILPVIIAGVMLLPLLKDSFYGEGLTRANSSYFTDAELTLGEKFQLLGKSFLAHWTPQFLFLGQLGAVGTEGESNLRHGDGVDGVLNWPMLFLLIVAGASWIRWKVVRRDEAEIYGWGMIFCVLGFLPAAMTTQVPHNNQGFLALPGFVILATVGIMVWEKWWRRHHEFYQSFALLILILVGVSFLSYQRNYYQIFAANEKMMSPPNNSKVLMTSDKYNNQHKIVSRLFAQNLREAFTYTHEREKQYQQIVVAVDFEQTYIYALLARKTKPEAWQGGSLSAKYLFLPEINAGELERKNSLIMVSPNKIKDNEHFKEIKPLKVFYDLNGEPNIIIYESFN